MPRPDTIQRLDEFASESSFPNPHNFIVTPSVPRRATLVVATIEVEGTWAALANKTFTADLRLVDEDNPEQFGAGELLDYCIHGSGAAGSPVWTTMKLVGIVKRGLRYRIVLGHDGGATGVYMALGSLLETPLGRAF